MELSGKELKQLHDALLSAYHTYTSLEFLVATELEKNLSAIAGSGELADVIFRLIRWAEAEGRLRELIMAAHDGRKGNTKLSTFVSSFLHPFVPPNSSINLVAETASLLAQAATSSEPAPVFQKAEYDEVEMVVEDFEDSGSYNQTRAISGRIPEFYERYTPEQIRRLVAAFNTNPEVYGCGESASIMLHLLNNTLDRADGAKDEWIRVYNDLRDSEKGTDERRLKIALKRRFLSDQPPVSKDKKLQVVTIHTDQFLDQVEAFRMERINAIAARRGPVQLPDGPMVIYHVIPIDAFVTRKRYDFTRLTSGLRAVEGVLTFGANSSYDEDGVVFHGLPHDITRAPKEWQYAQMRYNGIVEAVDCIGLSGGGKEISGLRYDARLVDHIKRILLSCQQIGITTPLFVLVTLGGVDGFTISVEHVLKLGRAIKSTVLALPVVEIEDYMNSVESSLKPALDAFWNAAGYPQSMSYDHSGLWTNKEQ